MASRFGVCHKFSFRCIFKLFFTASTVCAVRRVLNEPILEIGFFKPPISKTLEIPLLTFFFGGGDAVSLILLKKYTITKPLVTCIINQLMMCKIQTIVRIRYYSLFLKTRSCKLSLKSTGSQIDNQVYQHQIVDETNKIITENGNRFGLKHIIVNIDI